MIKATVVVKDRKGSLVFTKTWETKNIDVAAEKFSIMYPDCWVTVRADEFNFVAMQPLNMKKDEELIDLGKLSMNKYMSKWYGKTASKHVVEQDLVEEFGEDVIL